MAFTFIHTADWQIGKPFAGFDGDLAVELKAARVDVIDRIADAARQNNAGHVLVTGDVWEQETPTDVTLEHTLQALQDQSDVRWWLLPGNHDPARPHGLWQRVLQHPALKQNVTALLQPEPVRIEEGVYILPSPWHSKTPARDLTTWMDAAATPSGAMRIGLAHGSVRDFGGEAQDTSVIGPGRAEAARLDYLALGDWHGVVKVDERTWYSGTPEPDRFVQNDPGWCLSVTCPGGGQLPVVKKISTAKYRWLRSEVEVVPDLPLDRLLEGLISEAASRRKMLLEVTLSGRADLQQRAELQQLFEAARPAFAHLSVDFENLETGVEDGDLDKIGLTGPLRAAADTLIAMSTSKEADSAARHDATRALDILFSLAARQQGGRG